LSKLFTKKLAAHSKGRFTSAIFSDAGEPQVLVPLTLESTENPEKWGRFDGYELPGFTISAPAGTVKANSFGSS
jgi:hypothetical protein